MTADILREKFLTFFKAKKHKVIASDLLVPKDDPTVLFTPAGMNQFKKEFMGFNSGFKRAATAQRCLRTDDLDKVGKTSVHHTFFEMLGNFSFGDYFKKEAISWAWEFLTEELKISSAKLWVSVYFEDDEAYNIWKDEIKIPEHKITRLKDKDNFWPAEAKTKGPNGPCGPCSEIFYDFGQDKGCQKPECSVACSCGRFAEIWNLVFTQYNRQPDGTLEALPHKNIDTGMGLERLAAVMQGKENNFQTDLFEPLTKRILAEIKNVNGTASLPLVYAISDHIRAVTFAIYDGVNPSNEARGYVVRKIIRKSVLHLRAQGIKREFFYSLVETLALIMARAYPDLSIRAKDISEIVCAEEKNFIATLNSSAQMFKNKFSAFLKAPNPEAVGKLAFVLHDTYGIPLELTRDWLGKEKIEFSQRAFAQALEEQKVRSKLGSAMQGDVFSACAMDIKVKASKFVGYEGQQAKAKILKIFKNGVEVKKGLINEDLNLVLDLTPFYAQSGGQVGDTGQLVKGKNIFIVSDTQKIGKVIVHSGKIKSGTFKVGDALLAQVDSLRRRAVARNHTATHLLQAVLREVLGKHVKQQGSLVEAERLRFDFVHFKDLDAAQLDKIEARVNTLVMENHSLVSKQMEQAAAKKTGALAFFAEKYSGKVRVVKIAEISQEFCGGTHLSATGEVGLFKITQEGSVASGVRRIQAVTGDFAYALIKEEEKLLQALSLKLNARGANLLTVVDSNLAQVKSLEKTLAQQKMNNTKDFLTQLVQEAKEFGGVKFIAARLENLDMDLLRKNVDLLKAKTERAVIALGSCADKRAFLVIGVTSNLAAQGLDAGKLIRQVAEIIGGNGGGRQDFAQAGGTLPENLEKVFVRLEEIVAQSL